MAYSDSAEVEVTLNAQGVWIHDPDDAEGTIRQFFYGSAQRSDDYSNMVLGEFYAGRTNPVFDFGEHEDEATTIAIDVPFGPGDDLAALRDFARTKKPLWVRDNRGRAVYGPMSQFRVNDTEWGATVSFVVERSDRDVTTALASLSDPVEGPEQP